ILVRRLLAKQLSTCSPIGQRDSDRRKPLYSGAMPRWSTQRHRDFQLPMPTQDFFGLYERRVPGKQAGMGGGAFAYTPGGFDLCLLIKPTNTPASKHALC